MRDWMGNYYNERRQKEDFWMKSIKWLNIFGWLLLFISLFYLEMAKPGAEAFRKGGGDVQLLQTWDMDYIKSMIFILTSSLIVSLLAIIINSKRHHRSNDFYRVSLFILGFVSILGIIYFGFGF